MLFCKIEEYMILSCFTRAEFIFWHYLSTKQVLLFFRECFTIQEICWHVKDLNQTAFHKLLSTRKLFSKRADTLAHSEPKTTRGVSAKTTALLRQYEPIDQSWIHRFTPELNQLSRQQPANIAQGDQKRNDHLVKMPDNH